MGGEDNKILPCVNPPFTGSADYICTMEVNGALVDKLAHLSRLSFNEEEKKKIGNDLEKMITFVEKLNELDTTGVEPLLYIGTDVNVLREDIAEGQVSTSQALRNAKENDGTWFRVPKVIKK